MTVASIIAIIIFVVMFILVITEKIEKHITTLCCGGLALIVVFGICLRDFEAIWNTINLEAMIQPEFWRSAGESESGGIDWATILFLAGMMIMVEGMARVGFFRWLCMLIAKLVKYKTVPIFIAFMTISFVLSMFIASITVILFLAFITVELSKLLKFKPVPMILAEIFCANLGGSATMCGDPPNIIIGTQLGYTFNDFIMNTGVIAVISFVFTVAYFYIIMRKDLKTTVSVEDFADLPAPSSAITDKPGFIISAIIFIASVILLITHGTTHLTVAAIGVIVAVVTLITSGKHILEVLKGVDYKTLLFFVGLFVVVSSLEQTGVLKIIAEFIQSISGGNVFLMVCIIIWMSGFASAFIDNIPFAATMVPVIKALAVTTGINIDVMAWSLAMGTDIGGSATPIGASANVVGTSAAAKAGHPIGWGVYCKKMVPPTIIVLLVTTVYICAVYL